MALFSVINFQHRYFVSLSSLHNGSMKISPFIAAPFLPLNL